MRKGILMIISLLFLSGCAITNKYEAYYGKVIDAETKEPLEGAAVLVVYFTEQYGVAGPVGYFADAQETVTDKNGEFRIPPIRITTLRPLSGWRQHPQVTIFKPRYGCYPWHKDARPKYDYASLPAGESVIIELPMLSDIEERIHNAGCLMVTSETPVNKYRKILGLINQERKSLDYQPIGGIEK
jgi:hypothetical protein